MAGIDLMEMLSGMGGRGAPSGPRRGRDVGLKMQVPLELLYSGATKEVELPRTVLCSACKGAGTKSGRSAKCATCQGQGMRVVRQQIAPGMIQQGIMPCGDCSGRGTTISDADKCGTCNGKCTVDVPRTLKVVIEPGMRSGAKIPFIGEGDEGPDISTPGDVYVILEQAPHDLFQRKGDDLYTTKTITLAQALTGATFTVEHLDGRTLLIQSQPGLVIKPGDKWAVVGEGMPKRGEKTAAGDLVVRFSLEFPRVLAEDQVQLAREGLPRTKRKVVDFGGAEEPMECFMDDYTLERWAEMNKITEEEEEDADDSPRGVRCAHQ
eukprot:TRINITY_DN60203_c0_g1_i1.p1 TRINITY_DN60203_c0_g1~~TRINITY_DN60203_c0_g1_i1.p1  ORF type:complete len:348 (+),score=50.94 TRINITY_DN60203_c0_g1_i1:79-1044(+)